MDDQFDFKTGDETAEGEELVIVHEYYQRPAGGESRSTQSGDDEAEDSIVIDYGALDIKHHVDAAEADAFML